VNSKKASDVSPKSREGLREIRHRFGIFSRWAWRHYKTKCLCRVFHTLRSIRAYLPHVPQSLHMGLQLCRLLRRLVTCISSKKNRRWRDAVRGSCY